MNDLDRSFAMRDILIQEEELLPRAPVHSVNLHEGAPTDLAAHVTLATRHGRKRCRREVNRFDLEVWRYFEIVVLNRSRRGHRRRYGINRMTSDAPGEDQNGR